MKIALIGYGKMGKMIEGIALNRGHKITCKIDVNNLSDFDTEAFRDSDVAIEFTTPGTAQENIERCFVAGVPVVCGTTGWTSHLEEMQERCDKGEGTLLWASNFSIGVNIFMAVNRYLSRIMESFPQYHPEMEEVHHVHKLDHPSGTAITLAEQLISNNQFVSKWAENEKGQDNTQNGHILLISHKREGEVPGIHTIKWDSDVDDITISHSAKSRAGFAEGAVIAAEWLADKQGFKTIGEMMADITKQDIFR